LAKRSSSGNSGGSKKKRSKNAGSTGGKRSASSQKKSTTAKSGGSSGGAKASSKTSSAGRGRKSTASSAAARKTDGVGAQSSGGEPKPGSRPRAAQEEQTVYVPEEPLSEEALRKCKSGLTKRDIAQFHQHLLEKRAELVGDFESLQDDTRDPGGVSHMPDHQADVGSDNYEHEFTLGLMESERRMVGEIDEALQRIADETYGVCLYTGRPIGKDRLKVKPWAKYSIEAVRELERRGEL
jgi:RNA polymerase-binding protein DksA